MTTGHAAEKDAPEILSLGAGVQSTALFILGCEGELVPKLDAAVFADTHWEPRHVMEHLANLQRFGAEHGVPVYLASRGDLAADVVNPQVYATIPAWTLGKTFEQVPVEWGACQTCQGESPLISPDDELCEDCLSQRAVPVRWETRHTKSPRGRVKRQCTPKYKIEVIQRQVRLLLGAETWLQHCRYCDGSGQRVAPWSPSHGVGICDVCRGTGQRTRVGSVPRGAKARQWIGFSTDEVERVSDAGFPSYQVPVHPLLDLRWSRSTCEDFLVERGWQAEKSACVGCPFHDDDVWIDMKHRDPEDYAAAVAFDEDPRFRNGDGMGAQRFLHEARIPLREAVEKAEARRRAAGEPLLLFGATKRPQRRGCSPYGCRSTEYIEEVEVGAS